MKQIVDKLNKIAKKIDANVDIPDTDLIIDSLDAITTALGGTPNDSNLIVDKLEDIAGVAEPKPTGNIELTENAENIDIAQYATATVNVSGGGGDLKTMEVTFNNVSDSLTANIKVLNINDGNLLNSLLVAPNTATQCNVPLIYYPPLPFPPAGDGSYVAEFSNAQIGSGEKILNNCTFYQDSMTGDCGLGIIDPTQPASAIIEIIGS